MARKEAEKGQGCGVASGGAGGGEGGCAEHDGVAQTPKVVGQKMRKAEREAAKAKPKPKVWRGVLGHFNPR